MMTNNTNSAKRKSTFTPTDAINFAVSFITENVTSTSEEQIAAIISKLNAELPAGSFPKEAIDAMAHEICNQAQNKIYKEDLDKQTLQRISPDQLTEIESLITSNAIALAALIQGNNQDGVVLTLGRDRLVDFLVALTARSLTSYHTSNWIRYDKKEIFALAGLSKLPASEQEELTQQAHNTFGFDMRVIGSNQPIPCYFIPWLVPPRTFPTPLSDLDPFKIKTSLMNALQSNLNNSAQ